MDKLPLPVVLCTVGLAALIIGPILWKALAYMEENSSEPHDQIKGGFLQESRLYKGPRGIMAAAALAESHRSGRERWRTGMVVLRDNDMGDYGVSVHAQWLVDNERNFPRWGIRVENRMSRSPRQMHKLLISEEQSYKRMAAKDMADERGYPLKLDKHERTRR